MGIVLRPGDVQQLLNYYSANVVVSREIPACLTTAATSRSSSWPFSQPFSRRIPRLTHGRGRRDMDRQTSHVSRKRGCWNKSSQGEDKSEDGYLELNQWLVSYVFDKASPASQRTNFIEEYKPRSSRFHILPPGKTTLRNLSTQGIKDW